MSLILVIVAVILGIISLVLPSLIKKLGRERVFRFARAVTDFTIAVILAIVALIIPHNTDALLAFVAAVIWFFIGLDNLSEARRIGK